MAYTTSSIANKLLVMSENAGELMTNMKLQKMMYYQQGYHLAMFNEPLFDEDIEAWMYGPVVPSIYYKYSDRGMEGIIGDKDSVIILSDPKEEKLFMDVFDEYVAFSAIGLMNMTHRETPWASTQTGKGNVISTEKMALFFRQNLAQW